MSLNTTMEELHARKCIHGNEMKYINLWSRYRYYKALLYVVCIECVTRIKVLIVQHFINVASHEVVR